MCLVTAGKEFQNRTIQVELARRKMRMNYGGGRGGGGSGGRGTSYISIWFGHSDNVLIYRNITTNCFDCNVLLYV